MNSKKITFGLLIFYLAALTWIIVFKLSLSLDDLSSIRSINLVPFSKSMMINGHLAVSEIIDNLLIFIPFGILLHTLFEQKSTLHKMIPIVLTSLMFETLQYVFAIGASDITDLLTNSLGGLIGIEFAALISRLLKKHWKSCVNAFSLIGAFLFSMLIALLVFSNAGTQRTYILNLPEAENVQTVKLTQNKSERWINDNDEIKEILNTICGIKRITTEESIQDHPVNTENEIEIVLNHQKEGTSVIYLYQKDNRYYIEQPYNGIYQISAEEYDSVISFLKTAP